jgi:hypothetical protein
MIETSKKKENIIEDDEYFMLPERSFGSYLSLVSFGEVSGLETSETAG